MGAGGGRRGYVPMAQAEVEAYLLALAGRLADALTADPGGRGLRRAGRGGAGARRDDRPEVLGSTVRILQAGLSTSAAVDAAGSGSARLLAALAVGYTRALRERTLDEQERLRQAALAVRAEADRALRASEARSRRAWHCTTR
jgi:hypothetical protein